jgi:hypothetical protein
VTELLSKYMSVSDCVIESVIEQSTERVSE